MPYPELLYRWTWMLRASPEQLWPFVADTNRFNRDVGLPAVQSVAGGPDVNARRRLGFSRLGLRFEWDEEPFEWVRPERFSVRRRYRSGPLDSLTVNVTLTPRPEGGTLLVYESRVRPKALLALLGLPFAMGVVNKRAFARAFRAYDEVARLQSTETVTPVPMLGGVELVSGGAARLEALRRRLPGEGLETGVVDRLARFVETADDVAVARIEPYALADEWGVSRRSLLEACLRATKAGMLDLQWDLLCPLCRGAKESANRLADLGDGVHCDTCNIDVSANIEGSVELTFRVNASIRALAADEMFCVAGPRVTPHVVVQQLIAAGETREVRPAIEAGRYRLRSLGIAGAQLLSASEDGAEGATVRLSDAGWPDGELSVSTKPALRLENATPSERLVLLERLAWADRAVTAAEVIGLQTFRDLFSGELLRPGREIQISSLTIAFTDLRDSTRMYQELGDAPAFGRVLDHFEVLRDEVGAEGGAVIKTIGDAVMAVFPRPVGGVRAMLRAQARLAASEVGGRYALKAGLHEGSCIAVTLNERLDYFGTAVNLASRLERYSTGEDVIVSDAVRDDPEVDAYLRDESLAVAPFETQIKGFEAWQFRLWRLSHSRP